MRRSSGDFKNCQIRAEVTLMVKGRRLRAGEWNRVFGQWLPMPERFGGYFKNGQSNERQLGFDDPGGDAVSVRRKAKAAIKPFEGLEIGIVVDVGEVIGA